MNGFRILICLNHLSYRSGGVSTHILDLCKEYARIGLVEKIVVACEWGEHIDELKDIKKSRIHKNYILVRWNDSKRNIQII